ncbi:Rv3235 family protein [Streptomyces sp. NPDC047928]|uniref:Rv3235 family protein n=1 Tax=unclassified Streptomyces TaxID=2593676 RepID=UPI003713644E
MTTTETTQRVTGGTSAETAAAPAPVPAPPAAGGAGSAGATARGAQHRAAAVRPAQGASRPGTHGLPTPAAPAPPRPDRVPEPRRATGPAGTHAAATPAADAAGAAGTGTTAAAPAPEPAPAASASAAPASAAPARRRDVQRDVRRDPRGPGRGALSRPRAPRPRPLPPHAVFAERLLAVLSGERPVHWMLGQTIGEAYEQLVRLAPANPLRPVDGPGGRGVRPVVRRCAGSPLRPGVVEAYASVVAGGHIRAMAFRLELGEDRKWRCAAVELGTGHTAARHT